MPTHQTELPAESSVQLGFQPSYLSAVSGEDRLYVYLEAHQGGYHGAFGLELDRQGSPLSPLTPLVEPFEAPFGEIRATPDGLLVPVVRQVTEREMLWELWRWSPPVSATRLVQCLLDRSVHGQIVPDEQDLLVLLESPAGDLRLFRLDQDDPVCPLEEQLVTLAHPPLPTAYRVDWIGGRILLSGQTGDSFTIQHFDRSLFPLKISRLAAGTAGTAWDLFLLDHPDLGPLAVFSAQSEGSSDLYLAFLDQLSAGPLASIRIVGTAERERFPRLYYRGTSTLLSWLVFEPDTGETVLLASPVRLDGTALRGGEILWRPDGTENVQWTYLWTSSGLLRLWIDRSMEENRLNLSVVRPSFW